MLRGISVCNSIRIPIGRSTSLKSNQSTASARLKSSLSASEYKQLSTNNRSILQSRSRIASSASNPSSPSESESESIFETNSNKRNKIKIEMPNTSASHHHHNRSDKQKQRRIINSGSSRHVRITTTAALLAVLSTSFQTSTHNHLFTRAFSTGSGSSNNNNMSSTTTTAKPSALSSSSSSSSTTPQNDPSTLHTPHPLINLSSNFTNTWIQNLTPETPANRLRSRQSTPADDGHSNNVRRPVFNGHYVPVRPKPLTQPRLILHSPSVAHDLGLPQHAPFTDEFARFFSGDVTALPSGTEAVTWATPYALSIMGKRYTNNCPYGTGDGYGDGRAIYLAEVTPPSSSSSSPTPYELQLKGAGPTPFCRGADGRAVLRSSLREFLASEAMHTLGVSTTRALSLVVSDGGDTSTRPWYSERNVKPEMPSLDDPRLERYGGLAERKRIVAQLSAQTKQDPDVMVEERNAITCRVARSFVRVGHVDLFARRVRAEGGGEEDKPDVEGESFRELADLLWHACRVEFPDACYDPFRVEDDLMGASKCLVEESMQGISTMVTEWVRVGFAQGNFNGDNCLVAGRTMDYGPFGFMDEYHPLFAKWTGSGDHFGFLNQPQAGFANFAMLLASVMPVIEAYSETMADANAFRDQMVEKAQDVFGEKFLAVFRVKMGFHPSDNKYDSLWDELESILTETRADWTLFWRQLSTIVKEYPVTGNDVSTSYGEMMTLLQGDEEAKPGSSAFYTPLDIESKAKLLKWIQSWREGLVESYGENGSSTLLARKDSEPPLPPKERMRLANPKYVLREWMFVEAYSKASPESVSSSANVFRPSAAASQSDESLIHELFDLILNPYDEGTEEQNRKYYRRAPDASLQAGGTAFMS